jgi:hypothetical protein
MTDELKEALQKIAELEVLLAWQHEDLTEGQVCHLLDLAPVDVREKLQEAVANAQIRWAKWRGYNPPSHRSGV